ncbi:reverse transcriptase domain-containing protein [Tanacetum coccineum]
MLRDIDETFCTLRKINMKLNPKKCTFGAVKGMFLGYMISPEGIKNLPEKTDAVTKLPSSRIIKEVQSLNGKLASLNRFLSKSAEKSLPIFKTLKKCIKKSDFHWTPDAEQAFKQLKQHLSELPLLILADFLVENPDEGPPYTLVVETPQEPWTLFTDGSSCVDESGTSLILTSLEGTEFTYALRFQFTASNNEAEYEALIAGLRIAAQMGVRNVHVLVEILKEKSIQEKEVTTMVEEDGLTWMTPIIEYLKEGTLPDEKKVTSKLRIKARQYELWKGVLYMRSFLKPWLRRYGLFHKVDRGESRVNNHWQSGKEVRVDNIVALRHTREIVSDNGKQFSDNPFKDWCEKLNITQCFASVKHPQSNGLVEIANRSLGDGIKARPVKGNKNWIEELPHVLWAHRTTIKSSHGNTLFSLTYGTEAVIPAEIRMPTYRTAAVDVHNDEELQLNLDLLEERRERAAIREAKAKLQMTKYYNARVRGVTFRPGDFVYRSNDANHVVAGGKLGPKWEGPYEVTEALGDGAYRLRSMDGTVLPRTWNIANLKKCYL